MGWLLPENSAGYRFDCLLSSIASCAAVGGGLWLFAALARQFFHRDAFGMGDVKYMAAIAGCFTYAPALLILILSCALAVVCVGVYRLFNRRRAGRVFPFGPFLSIALFLWMFLGSCLASFLAAKFPAFPDIFWGF